MARWPRRFHRPNKSGAPCLSRVLCERAGLWLISRARTLRQSGHHGVKASSGLPTDSPSLFAQNANTDGAPAPLMDSPAAVPHLSLTPVSFWTVPLVPADVP